MIHILVYEIIHGAPIGKYRDICIKVLWSVVGPFQNTIVFQNKFLFLFCPPLKYFSLPILLIEKIVRKSNFFPPSEDLSKF
jgi:hypothetical protein